MPYIIVGAWALVTVGLLVYANSGNSISVDKARGLTVTFIFSGAVSVGALQIVQGEQDVVSLFSNVIAAFSAALAGAFASHGFVPKKVGR